MVNADSPIRSEKDDLLNRHKFASSLGKALLDWKNEEGIVIGLYGKWGSGKSSTINLAVEFIQKETRKVKKNDTPIIIRFNPWNFTEQNQLITIFFAEIAKAIHYYDKGEDAKKVGKKLITYSKFFTVLGLVPGLDPYTKIVEKVFKQVGETTKEWGELQTKNLEQYKEELDNSIRKLNRKIVIVIDDIDRLNLKEVKQIFQLVKQNANFPNTIYVLALDQQKVVEQIQEDTEFLEKIIQVGFHIPSVEDIRLKKILFSELDQILKPFPEELWSDQRWSEVFHGGYKNLFDSVRKIKRYVNSLRFNINIISSEINPLDFFVIEAIRVFFPSFYEEIARGKELFVGKYFLDNDRDRELRKKQFENFFDVIKVEDERKIVRSMIFELFPQVEGVYRNQSINEQDDWFKEKRVCSEDRFGNYFYLSLSEGEISQQEMDVIINSSDDPDKLKSILENLLKENRIRRCLERLPEFIDKVPAKNVYTFVLPFFNISDRISRQREGDLDFGPEIQVVRLAYHLVKKLDAKYRAETLKKLIDRSESIDAPIRFVSIQKDEDAKKTEEKLIESTETEKLVKTALNKIRTFAKTGQLSKTPGMAYLLYRWKNWESLDKPKKYVEELVKTSKGIASLLKGFTAQSISNGKKHYRLSYKELKEFMDLQVLKDRISKLTGKDKKLLDKEGHERIEDFIKGVDKALSGKNGFDID